MTQLAEGTLAASSARTTTLVLDPLILQQAASATAFSPLMGIAAPAMLEVVIDTTVFGTGSVTPIIEAYDEAKGGFVTVLAGAAIVATGTVVLRYGKNVTSVTNLAQQGIVPKRWRVTCTANNANSQTYSVSARVTG